METKLSRKTLGQITRNIKLELEVLEKTIITTELDMKTYEEKGWNTDWHKGLLYERKETIKLLKKLID